MDLQAILGQELFNAVVEKTKGIDGKLIWNNGEYVPRERLKENEKEEEIKKLKAQLADLENITAKVSMLEKTVAEKDEQYLELKKNSLIDLSLVKNKAKNPKAVKALLNMEELKLENDTLVGLDEQIETIKTTDAYLFHTVEIPNTQQKGVKNEEMNILKKGNLTEIAKLKKDNPTLYFKLQQNS